MIDFAWLAILAAPVAWTVLVPRFAPPPARALGCLGPLAAYLLGFVMLLTQPFGAVVATWGMIGLASGISAFAVEWSMHRKAMAAGVTVWPRPAAVAAAILFWPGRLPRSLNYWLTREAPLSPEATRFLDEAVAEFDAKQESLRREWRFGSEAGAQWGFDQTTGIFTLTFPDGAQAQADGQVLGSYQASDGTWEWAWNNPNVERAVARDSVMVRDVGRRLGIAYLEAGKIPAPTDHAVTYCSSIGLKATGAAGVFRGSSGPVDVIIMLKNLRWARTGGS